MFLLNYIIWNGNPEIFHLGFISIKWYGLLFAMGFWIASIKVKHLFKQENKPEQDVDILILYAIVATGVGARLGHVLFYEFTYYIKHPLEAILPITFNPTFKFVGYRGLASHGAAIAIILALYLYTNYSIKISLFPPQWKIKKQQRSGGQRFMWLLDRAVIFAALGGSLIRVGNFMNSEIIGKPTHSNYGVVFAREAIESLQNHSNAIAKISINKGEKLDTQTGYPPLQLALYFKPSFSDEKTIRSYLEKHIKPLLTNNQYITDHIFISENQLLNYTLSKNRKGSYVANIAILGKPRHPSQLYEAFTTFLLFCLLYYRWSKKKQYLKDGELAGIFFIILFSLRFVQEFFKEHQVDFERTLPLNMGQWLSIPFFFIGVALFLYSRSRKTQSG